MLSLSATSYQVRHLLKLSPEKWEEVSQHALAAVVPDFRNRVWWCPMVRSGLLYACKNGAVAMEHPIGEMALKCFRVQVYITISCLAMWIFLIIHSTCQDGSESQ